MIRCVHDAEVIMGYLHGILKRFGWLSDIWRKNWSPEVQLAERKAEERSKQAAERKAAQHLRDAYERIDKEKLSDDEILDRLNRHK